ncbi:DUF3150 domain-containing protein [Lentisphaerota bacterium WC36G]|nr:DUF3150 domain-containing protein [Lentisphaerae bacterium WC36]
MEITSKGYLSIYPNKLKIFSTLKSRAVKLLDKFGVRFLGGWGVPMAKADEIVAELKNIQTEFMTAKSAFIKNYDKAVKNWIKNNSEWENMIKNSVVSSNYVAGKIDFIFQLFEVKNNATDNLNTGLNYEVSNLGNRLFDEVAKQAQQAYDKSFKGKSNVTRKALSPLKLIRHKLSGLSFTEPHVCAVVSLIDNVLTCIPKRGAIKGENLEMLKKLLELIAEKQTLLDMAEKILNGTTEQEIIQKLMVVSTKSKPKKSKTKVKTNNHIDSCGLW